MTKCFVEDIPINDNDGGADLNHEIKLLNINSRGDGTDGSDSAE